MNLKFNFSSFAVLIATICENVRIASGQSELASYRQSLNSQNRFNVVEGQYIVKLSDDSLRGSLTSVASVAELLLQPLGSQAQILHTYSDVFPGFSVHGLSKLDVVALKRDGRVKYITQSQTMELSNYQENVSWNLDRLDQNSCNFDNAYTCSATGQNVTVFVLDSGIMANHSEFKDSRGRSRVTNGFNVHPSEGWNDLLGHGTHVAATIGGTKYGVAKTVQLVNVKVFSKAGLATSAGLIAAMDYVVGQKRNFPSKPMVMNLSLGGNRSIAVNDAANSAVSNGIFVVAAAGNDFDDACKYSPASADFVMTVGGSQVADYVSNFTNTGDCVDIYAPGLDILSASNECTSCIKIMSGTSMAAAHVSGVAAQVLQGNPQANPSVVLDELIVMSSEIAISDFEPFKMRESKRKTILRTSL